MAKLDLSPDDYLSEDLYTHVTVLGGEWPLEVIVSTVKDAKPYAIPRDRVRFRSVVRFARGSSSEDVRQGLAEALERLAAQIRKDRWRGWDAENV